MHRSAPCPEYHRVPAQQDEAQMNRLTERMRGMLEPFLLRRLKSEVASQLTAKRHQERRIPMVPVQAALYQAAVTSLRSQAATAAKAAKPGELRSESPVDPSPDCICCIACDVYAPCLCNLTGI